jgi:hypothetical protein
VYGVGVVPHHQEVGCGALAQPGNPLHGCVAVHAAGGVREARHAPHPAYAGILRDQSLREVHVGPILQQGYVDHLDTEVLADCEVPVVTRYRAEELHAVVIAPGCLWPAQALAHGQFERGVHQVEAGIAANQGLFRRGAEQRTEALAQFRQALQAAVVAHISAVRREVIPSQDAVQGVR